MKIYLKSVAFLVTFVGIWFSGITSYLSLLFAIGEQFFSQNYYALAHTPSSRTTEQKRDGPDSFAVFLFSEFLKVFSSNGTEIFTHERCYEDHQVVELQFGEGDFVTLNTQLYSRYSRLRLEFVVVRRSLHSGIPRKSLF